MFLQIDVVGGGMSLGGKGGGESEMAVLDERSGIVSCANEVSGVVIEVSRESIDGIGREALRRRFGVLSTGG